eukprot:354921-Chlamydomonas_euryale.AAC.18
MHHERTRAPSTHTYPDGRCRPASCSPTLARADTRVPLACAPAQRSSLAASPRCTASSTRSTTTCRSAPRSAVFAVLCRAVPAPFSCHVPAVRHLWAAAAVATSQVPQYMLGAQYWPYVAAMLAEETR